jgi:hypothetical protein
MEAIKPMLQEKPVPPSNDTLSLAGIEIAREHAVVVSHKLYPSRSSRH